ncbi:MAG: NAD(P)/FAD-dependent oxidoreductase, partial [Campylobacter sp.]|nr:NAD(P)/FAD-dependent oxidoreductase [Campylobacter sp.]
YFIGEVLDITGMLGGYNLHFAFVSALKVASALKNS